MLKRVLLAAGIFIVLFAPFYASRHRILCRGFLPPNGMKIPVGQQGQWGALSVHPNGTAGGISEETYNQVLDKAQEIYGPIVKAHGGNLVINHLWTDPTVNSDARRDGSDWVLDIDGGIARYKTMTKEGFTLVVCHELGHHLGGYPKENGLFSKLVHGTWASNEGEADYFATLKCLPRMIPAAAPSAVDETVSKDCALVYGQSAGAARCVTDAMSATAVVELFQELGGGAVASFATPDPKQVWWTGNGHPNAQCRLDTYFAGALCNQPIDSELSDTAPDSGACTAPAFSTGLRPLCWYAPPSTKWSWPMTAGLNLPKPETMDASLQSMSNALMDQK